MAIVAYGYARSPVGGGGGAYVAVGDVVVQDDPMVATVENLDETADLPEDLTATLESGAVDAELATQAIDAELEEG